MKTLLEVIKLNKTNIDKVQIGKDPKHASVGDIVEINNRECLCVGPINDSGENGFAIIPDYKQDKKPFAPQDSDFLDSDLIPYMKPETTRDGKEMTDYIKNEFPRELSGTLWEDVEDDEFIPSRYEFRKIMNNIFGTDKKTYTNLCSKLSIPLNNSKFFLWTSSPFTQNINQDLSKCVMIYNPYGNTFEHCDKTCKYNYLKLIRY